MAMGSSEADDLRPRLEEVLGPDGAEKLLRRLPEGEVVTKEDLEAQFKASRRDLKEQLSRYATKEDLTGFRGEMREEFASFRGEMREEFASFREEMHEKFASFREEMREEFASFRGEMREEFASFRGEMREEFASFRGEIRVEMRDLMREQTRTLTFAMVGTMITLTGAVITAAQVF